MFSVDALKEESAEHVAFIHIRVCRRKGCFHTNAVLCSSLSMQTYYM